MKNPGKILRKIFVFFLVMLWAYAAISKLLDFRRFDWEMHSQAISPILASLLTWFLPPAELMVAGLLTQDNSRKSGLYASLLLLFVFTIYISLVLGNVFKRVPCSCGGVLENMGWGPHLIFNIACLAINLTAILTIRRKEPVTSKTF